MADIFLSYAREDEPRARQLAAALESRGWSVWWDRRIPHGKDFNAYIEEQLEAARCIVVLWSAAALASKFVRDEATEGLHDGRLVPCLLGTVKQPLGFRQLQAANLADWNGQPPHDDFDRLVESIGAVVPPSVVTSTVPPAPVSRPAAGQLPIKRAPAVAPARGAFDPSPWDLPSEELLGFVEIPAGPFTMGSDKHRDDQAFDNELPEHQVPLRAFFMGRYEVTVGQFKACVKDGGCTPGDRAALEGPDDLPVRRVSWHEARAYCTWLESKLKEWKATPAKLATALAGQRDGATGRVRLPSEAEWERAARGTDRRIYPWGDRPDPSKANYDETKRGGPTPVGSFPSGASPEGLLDMSGNVWEWTRSLWGTDVIQVTFKYPYVASDGRENEKAGDNVRRVVRGGSFDSNRRNVRAASRFRDTPNYRLSYVGFRVVVSPFSSDL